MKTQKFARLFSPVGILRPVLSFGLMSAVLLALCAIGTPAHAFQIQIQPPFKIKKKPPTPKAKDKPPPDTIQKYEAMIDPEAIRGHVKFLSDDDMEGRYPGLRGGNLAAKYIASQFQSFGLKPAGDSGTYFQNIDFIGMKAKPDETTFSIIPSTCDPIPL